MIATTKAWLEFYKLLAKKAKELSTKQICTAKECAKESYEGSKCQKN